MRAIILTALFFAGCARQADDGLMHVVVADFHAPRLARSLNYYVAHYSSHATNHFYVGPIEVHDGQLVRALVYWKEERTLLPYAELTADTADGAEGFAWHGHDLKLDRDTVDSPADIAGSTYLVTHRIWMDLMDECVARGRPYSVLRSEARQVFAEAGASR
jgi:hypothetical protein